MKAMGSEMEEIGHFPHPFGASWWAIDMEDRAAEDDLPIDAPPSYCVELARAAFYSPRRADSAQSTYHSKSAPRPILREPGLGIQLKGLIVKVEYRFRKVRAPIGSPACPPTRRPGNAPTSPAVKMICMERPLMR